MRVLPFRNQSEISKAIVGVEELVEAVDRSSLA